MVALLGTSPPGGANCNYQRKAKFPKGNVIRSPEVRGLGASGFIFPQINQLVVGLTRFSNEWVSEGLTVGVKRPRLYLVLLILRISGPSPPFLYLISWNSQRQLYFQCHQKTK
jgi:hypothetical protein